LQRARRAEHHVTHAIDVDHRPVRAKIIQYAGQFRDHPAWLAEVERFGNIFEGRRENARAIALALPFVGEERPATRGASIAAPQAGNANMVLSE
jgi:hypothetical protein